MTDHTSIVLRSDVAAIAGALDREPLDYPTLELRSGVRPESRFLKALEHALDRGIVARDGMGFYALAREDDESDNRSLKSQDTGRGSSLPLRRHGPRGGCA